ncbi:hypothetical protein F4821DRAFT_257083 [Hypoxylon rubiginosum]|uniref:Uncharacterized protein n=1 Tax=Hypoxylon rubiginosum TaxID=110542 RepID=A0ACC0D994_9PEZI|nr:hypothetical protein F4821DRAFT_257083 [Hypoxylon rubiginosum]
MSPILPIISSIIIGSFIILRFRPFSLSRAPLPLSHDHEPKYDPSYEDCTDWNTTEPETHRVVFGSRWTTVYGYPSSGGVLVLPFCNGVDLSFLQLARFSPAERSDDPAAEDQHCVRMRKLGAWKFASVWEYDTMDLFHPGKLDAKMLVVAAWPGSGAGGGVWVLKTPEGRGYEKGLARVWNALDMDERCEVVKSLGGTFYEDPARCPDLEL